MSVTVALPHPEDTDTLAQALASVRPSCAVIFLHGDLGAGKTSLARAMLRSLGVAGTIKSPTYTLIERYPLTNSLAKARHVEEAVHMDLYRIADSGELDFLGLDELLAVATLWLVEWPERGGRGLPAPDLHIALTVDGSGRLATLDAASPTGRDWLQRLSEMSGLALFSDK